MASFKEYTASGGASEAFAIPSFTSDEIKVRVDGVLKTAATHYNITSYTVNGGTVTWTSGNVPNGVTVRIYRETDVLNNADTDIEPYATYYAGSSIKADDLNGNQKQILRALVEGRELKQTWQIGSSQVKTDNIANDAINGYKIADDQINSEHYAPGSIDTEHIGNSQVTTDKIADDAVTQAKIANDAVGADQLASNSVVSDSIVDGTIVTADIANGAITAAKIATNAITTDNIVGDAVDTGEIKDNAVTLAKLAANSVDSSKIVDNTIVNADINTSAAIVGSKLADDSIAKEKISDTILKALATNLTSSTTELNQLDGKTITNSLSSNNTTIPTGAAVNSHVINLLDALGGFVAIANEVSFPNTNPDPEDNAGTAVSIGDAGGVSIDSNGASTTGRTLGGSTVTITGFPNAMKGVVGGANKVLPAGMGLIVQTTSTLNTYTYHKAIGTDSDIITISDSVSSFNQRYRFGSTDPTSDNDQGDLFFNTSTNLFKVYDDGAWIKTVPSDGDLSNIAIVAGEIGWSDDLGSITDSLTAADGGDINTVADNITAVTRYANEYKIAANEGARASTTEGHLWYDSTNNVIKFYNGSAWLEAFSSASLLDEDNMASNSATQVPSQQSVKAYVDGQTENDTTYAISCVDGDNSDEEKIRLTAGGTGSGTDDVVLEAGTGLSVARSGDKITFTNTAPNTDTQLTQEQVEDFVGGMLDGTETGISVTYDDTDGNIDFVVASQTDENFTTADHAKLDGIEASATADQTAAEIRTLVESASDSNVFTDADHSKLNAIEASATADQTDAEIRAAVEAATDSNVFTDADHSKLNAIEASATADQTGAEIKSAYEGESDTNAYTDAEKSKLAGIEASATADQSNAEIRAAVEAASDSNVFTDADHTKLNGVAASANNYAISSDLLDEDNMSSNSATKVPSQQSVKAYVDTEVAGVVDSAPGALNTLNELAAALGDDANFSTTVTNSIATKLPLGGGTMTGNIVMSGSETVDGRDLSVDGAKLDGIEASATADQSNAEIRAAVEAASDSNVFTDADHSKLNGIEASATADQTNAEIRAAVEAASDSNVFTDADHTKLNGIAASANNYTHPNHSGEVTSSADGATVVADNVIDEANLKVSNSPTDGYFLSAQSGNTGGLTWATVSAGSDTTYTHTWQDSSDNAILRLTAGGSGSGNDDLTIVAGSNITLTPSGDNLTIAATDTNTTYSVGDGGLTQNNFTNTLKSKLDGIEASATADQSAAEIVALIAGQTIAPGVITTTNLTMDFGTL